MKIYTVHIRLHALNPDRDLAVVKEGFNWPAFLFSGLWAFSKRMWIVSLLIFAVGGVLQAALSLSGANDLSRWITHFGYLIVVGLTANDMRRQALERAGFAFVGLGTGDTPDEALSGFLATADPKLIQS